MRLFCALAAAFIVLSVCAKSADARWRLFRLRRPSVRTVEVQRVRGAAVVPAVPVVPEAPAVVAPPAGTPPIPQ